MNGCSIEADPKKFEARTPQGLVKGHAYTITKVRQRFANFAHCLLNIEYKLEVIF